VKIMGRLIFLLLVSAAIAGGIYLIVDGSSRGAATVTPREDSDRRDAHAQGINRSDPLAVSAESSFARPSRHGRFGDHGDRSRDRISFGRGLAGILRNLAILAVIVVVVTRIKRRYPGRTS
jgi:hypothetical protein